MLTGAMVLQPLSALLMRRSRRIGYALLAMSLVALAAASAMAVHMSTASARLSAETAR